MGRHAGPDGLSARGDQPVGKDVLLARAAQIDAGFDIGTLVSMIATLDRFADDEIPVPEGSSVAELRAFYAAWRSELMKLGEG